ncbi:MAG: ACP S-malonyltransferase [Aquiluna sp.]|nr:ACP S-malonyltransferase [Aquiluna sp.]
MRILMCPGQGSQSEGFLIEWFASVPGFQEKIIELGKAAGKDLVRLGTVASEDEIKATENAQPLIVAASIAAARTAINLADFDGVVGHSVGEFAAAAISGVLSDEDAMKMVSVRANAMAEAAKLEVTSMAAVLGGEQDQVLAALEELGLSAANYNGAGQIVAAGSKAAITQLVATPPEKSRVIELKVAGAFHTHFMQPAVTKLSEVAATVSASMPQMKLWSNVDGALVTDGERFLASLVSQVSNPVRWDLCMASIEILSATVIELPPAGALAGLAKRGMPNSTAVALKNPTDLEKIGA